MQVTGMDGPWTATIRSLHHGSAVLRAVDNVRARMRRTTTLPFLVGLPYPRVLRGLTTTTLQLPHAILR